MKPGNLRVQGAKSGGETKDEAYTLYILAPPVRRGFCFPRAAYIMEGTMSHYLFTSESVTEGHPDKICDQISDAVLDAILAADPEGRVACETTASTGLIHIMGEISTKCYVDIAKLAREVVREIGYDRSKYGFDCDTCGVIINIDEQSGDIAMGVDRSLETKTGEDSELQNGAGDQGMMFG